MGKGPFSFRRTSVRRRLKKTAEPPSPTAVQQIGSPTTSPPLNSTADNNNISSLVSPGVAGPMAVAKGKKKTGGARLWMRFDRSGQSELVECDKSTIIRRASIPARDLRILGPVFSHSSNILGTLRFDLIPLLLIYMCAYVCDFFIYLNAIFSLRIGLLLVQFICCAPPC